MNNVQLIGRLTGIPDLRFLQSGMQVVRFNLAVDKMLSKEKKEEAKAKNQPTADFISCVAWGKLAETIANYTQKGSKIGVTGRIQTGSYDKDGQKVYTTDVVVTSMDLLDAPQQNNQASQPQGNNYQQQQPQQPQQPQQQPQQQGNNYQQQVPDGFFPVDNADIPF